MKLPILSASSTRRWLACALSAQLPQDEGEKHPSAAVGTRFHELVEGAITARQWPTIDPLEEHMAPALRATLDWFATVTPSGSETILAEQAYDLAPLGTYVKGERREPTWRDSMVCERLPRGGHRNYPGARSHIYGTADVVILDKGHAHVIDWKTGRASDDHEPQLKTLALMVAEAEHVQHVTASAVYVNLQTAKVKAQTWVFDSFDLHLHAGAITGLARTLLDKRTADPTPGKYCFFCPAVGCPEKLRGSR